MQKGLIKKGLQNCFISSDDIIVKLFLKKGWVCRNGRKGEKLFVCKKEVVEMAEKM